MDKVHGLLFTYKCCFLCDMCGQGCYYHIEDNLVVAPDQVKNVRLATGGKETYKQLVYNTFLSSL